MYSVNGIALDNSAKDWWIAARTKSVFDLEDAVASVSSPGRDGVSAVRGTTGAPVWPITMRVPRARYEELCALFRAGGTIAYTAASSRSAAFTYLSHTIADENFVSQIVWVTYLIRLDGAFWRDTNESTSAIAALSSAAVAVTGLFFGSSAPIQDAIVRIKGATTGIQVTDTAGSWFTYAPALSSTQYLRFESETGRAFVTATDTWTGGTEVSGDVDFGGPRGVFEITPRLDPADPASRDGRLTVTTATRTGASIQVRGKGAYLV